MLRYLKLARAHSAPLETVPVYLSAFLATGEFFSTTTLAWGLVGFLYYIAGYAHNSLSDYKNGYDKEDEDKQHHPLNRGTISVREATLFVFGTVGVTTILAVSLIDTVIGYGVLVGAVAFGFIYNLFGKETALKPVFISLAHTGVFALPYVSVGGGGNDLIFALATVFMFVWVFKQIAISGEMKDIGKDEKNFLNVLGTTAKKTDEWFGGDFILDISVKTAVLDVFLMITKVLVAFSMLFLTNAYTNVFQSAVVIFTCSALLTASFTFLTHTTYTREYVLSRVALIEALTLGVFCAALSGVNVYILLLFPISVVYVFVMNRVMWGTFLAPDV